MTENMLPIPEYFDPEKADQVWKVPYQERALQARAFAREHQIRSAADDNRRVELVLIDVQNTFCLPDFELFVAGRSGTGAVDDNRRLTQFIYRNLPEITGITATLDTHYPLQIFHEIFLVNSDGDHPEPNTLITHQDINSGKWQINPAAAQELGMDREQAQDYLRYYTARLAEKEKFDLTIWPYHALLGGIGHALVSTVEEAVFFHSIARQTNPTFHLKGNQVLTEAYSAVGPEVNQDPAGNQLAERSEFLLEIVKQSAAVIIAGQAQSHCVAWTVNDLGEQIKQTDPKLAERVFLLEDCTSPVVIPDVVDFTPQAEEAYQRFARAGMQIIDSGTALSQVVG